MAGALISEDKLEILENSSSAEANDSEIERLVDEKSGKTITAKHWEKNHMVIKKYDKQSISSELWQKK